MNETIRAYDLDAASYAEAWLEIAAVRR